MSRTSKAIGSAGEEQAVSALSRIGVHMVEEIGTPFKMTQVSPAFTKRGIFQVSFGKKVAGDHRGVAKGGLSVLIEVKTAFGRNLVWSDLLPHQPLALDYHNELDAISLLVYVTDNGVHVMRWPIAGFGPGKGITPQHADEIAINSEKELLAGRIRVNQSLLTTQEQVEILEYIRWRAGSGNEPDSSRLPMWLADLEAARKKDTRSIK